MRFNEIVDENFLLKGLNAIKNVGSKASTNTPAVKPDAALRAQQDARLRSLGSKLDKSVAMQPGSRVRIDTHNAAKDFRFTKSASDISNGITNYQDGRIIKIIPSNRAGHPDTLQIKLDNGNVVTWWADNQFIRQIP